MKLRILGVVFLAILLNSNPLSATITKPTLLIEAATAFSDSDGVIVRVEGTFPYAELIQRGYPMQIFVREGGKGTRFVCLSPSWGLRGGDHPLVKDGLDSKIAWQLRSITNPIDDAHFVSVNPGVIEVQIPADFPTGIAEVQFFVLYKGAIVFSNPMPFVIEKAAK